MRLFLGSVSFCSFNVKNNTKDLKSMSLISQALLSCARGFSTNTSLKGFEKEGFRRGKGSLCVWCLTVGHNTKYKVILFFLWALFHSLGVEDLGAVALVSLRQHMNSKYPGLITTSRNFSLSSVWERAFPHHWF